MKKITILGLVLILLSFSLVGCGSNADQAVKVPSSVQTQKQEENQKLKESSISTVHVDKDSEKPNYFTSRAEAKITSTKNHLTWNMDTITLTAKKSSTTITSIKVNTGASQYDLSIPREIKIQPTDLTSIALSPSEKFIAINVFIQNVGNLLMVVNLDNGKSITLNNLTHVSYETIHAYNWSPIDDQLAFSYGDTSYSKLAIYDFNNQELKNLPEIKHLVSTMYIMWNKDGTDFDFISESPPDEFKLYRYEGITNTAEKISPISRQEFPKYKKFTPNYFRF
ncbi:hypothetical protein EJP77_00535 [Paenibacillus zeisoli]|uniref:Lipoprotein n=1 Tax=Paenibacillus zeisoli TaxID=2496267 RepID=A0A3S1BAC2_9BACL|nr:hypothetical protein [Paenibacillus zeisoli]RUT35545.1 hypothetical protein EJP77_00535 [Paenibacillus zeisoli]